MHLTNDYTFLLKDFSEEIIQARYDTLESEIKATLKSFNLENIVNINFSNFNLFILSYFTDIARLKSFEGIDKVNIAKIYAYTVYWFCRMHPLNIVNEDADQVFINERVILYLHIRKLLGRMNIDENKIYAYGQILESCELMLYNLKYRVYTPQSLECAFLNLLNASTMKTIIPE